MPSGLACMERGKLNGSQHTAIELAMKICLPLYAQIVYPRHP